MKGLMRSEKVRTRTNEFGQNRQPSGPLEFRTYRLRDRPRLVLVEVLESLPAQVHLHVVRIHRNCN